MLDVGCGNGKLLTGLPEGVSYLGTDFSETMLSEARKLHPGAEFRYADVLSSADWEKLGIYDAIFCVALLHHIPEREVQIEVLRQMYQHLKPGGLLYLTVWNLWQERFLQYHLETHVEVPYNKKWKRYCVAYELPDMMKLMQEAGWVVEEIFYADKEGRVTEITRGENLVVVATRD